MKITSRDIVSLLAQKHSEDVFVDECKDGPSYGGGHCRIDGWAMKRAWSKPLVIGYEIKVSRSDFLQDEKWPRYLDMCNQLYFVCPPSVIEPAEIPEGVGLMWSSKNAARLYTKIKAPYRQVEIHENVWRYILMCRTVITREHYGAGKRAFWENWLRQKKIDQSFGYRVASTLAKRIKEEITAVQNENDKLKTRMGEYDDIRTFLESIGIDSSKRYRVSEWDVKHKLDKLREVVPDGLIHDLKTVGQRANNAAIKLELLLADEKEKAK